MDHNCHIFILEYEHHPFFKCHFWIFAFVLPHWVSSNWIIILKVLKLAATTPKEKRGKEHFSAKFLFLKILLNNNPVLSIEMMHPLGNEFSTFVIFQKSKHFKGLFKVKILEHNLVTASKGRRPSCSSFTWVVDSNEIQSPCVFLSSFGTLRSKFSKRNLLM